MRLNKICLNELWYANGRTYRPFIPTTPHTAAGIRIEPPPSVPNATGHKHRKKKRITGLQCVQMATATYHVAINFLGSLFLRIDSFFVFCGNYFLKLQKTSFSYLVHALQFLGSHS